MIGIFLLVSFIIYVVLSWMIIYHLQTYTIDKILARRAIIIFITVTIFLVVVQLILFMRIESMTIDAIESVRTDAFGTF